MNTEIEAPRILVVDDNEINRDICALNLESLSAELFFAENGLEGLQLVGDLLPDLILLDIMMPEMDGLEMLRRLKVNPHLKHIPVLMLTARSETESIVHALNIGANDYLKKPFEEEEMVARVKTLLRNRFLERKLAEDLAAGARIQKKFFTEPERACRIFDSSGVKAKFLNFPYAAISGDFYLCHKKKNGETVFFLGDSCGHGLSAALISMRAIGYLQLHVEEDLPPSEILRLVNRDLCGLMPKGLFVAATCLTFGNKDVVLSNGGQPYAIRISPDGIEEIVDNNMPLALHESSMYDEKRFPFGKGDRLLVYTDGLIEVTNRSGEIYGRRRLYRCLKSYAYSSTLDELAQHILGDVERFAPDAPREDDQTLVLFERS